jgi:hypothetical protein
VPRHRRVSSEPGQQYQIRFQPAARRAIAERLPATVAAAMLEFCEAALAVNPHPVGKPLFGPRLRGNTPADMTTEATRVLQGSRTMRQQPGNAVHGAALRSRRRPGACLRWLPYQLPGFR